MGAHGLKVEVGTWTPTFGGNVVAGTHTYSKQVGAYYKIGKLIVCSFWVSLSAKDSEMSGITSIYGLPFSSAQNYIGANFSIYAKINFEASFTGRTQLLGSLYSTYLYSPLIDLEKIFVTW